MLGHRGLRQSQLAGEIDHPRLAGSETLHDPQPGLISHRPKQRDRRGHTRRDLGSDADATVRIHRHMTMVSLIWHAFQSLCAKQTCRATALGFAGASRMVLARADIDGVGRPSNTPRPAPRVHRSDSALASAGVSVGYMLTGCEPIVLLGGDGARTR
jgi:hypothetical protein